MQGFLGFATSPDSTTSLPAPLGRGHPTPDADLFGLDCVLEAVDTHRAFVAVRLGFDDETSDAFLEEDVA